MVSTARRVDHVTAIVGDLERCASALEKVLGVGPAADVSLPGMQVLTFRAGGVELHVNAPTGPGPVADHLAAHGTGYHHVAVCCDDLDASILELAARGLPSVGVPVEPAPGLREIFLDPRATGGLLVQLVERRDAQIVTELRGEEVDRMVRHLAGGEE